MQRQSDENRGNRAATLCPACGAGNGCAVAAGGPAASCWCMDAAARLPLPTAAPAACYCAGCLTPASAQAGGAQ